MLKQNTCWGSLTPELRCSRFILLPSRLGHSLGKSYPKAEMQSVYSTAPANSDTRWGSLTPVQICSRCILRSQPTWTLIGGVLPLCRDAVGVYYGPSRLGHPVLKLWRMWRTPSLLLLPGPLWLVVLVLVRVLTPGQIEIFNDFLYFWDYVRTNVWYQISISWE